MCAAISKYTMDGGPLFEARNVAERAVSSVPNGMVMKKRLYFTDIYRTYARTFEQEDKKRRRSLIT